MARRNDIDRLYRLLDDLGRRVDGARKLKHCTGYMDWPDRGVYVFFAPGERRESTTQPRVTRVGTHGVSKGSNTSFWDRLKQHYGTGSRSAAHPHGGAHRVRLPETDRRGDHRGPRPPRRLPRLGRRVVRHRSRTVDGPRRGVPSRTPGERLHPGPTVSLGRP
jgi:hypothetical protein